MPSIGQTVPIEYARGQASSEGFKAYVAPFTLLANVPQEVQWTAKDIGLDYIASMFVDNSTNTGHLTCFFHGSSWNFALGPNQQGFFPVLLVPGFVSMRIASTVNANVTIHFLNKEQLTQGWTA